MTPVDDDEIYNELVCDFELSEFEENAFIFPFKASLPGCFEREYKCVS